MRIPSAPLPHQRILIIDDNRAIHEDFRKILGQPSAADAALQAAEEQLFGTQQPVWYEVDTASQGMEGLAKVEQAVTEGRPYALAFVDVRMPPGINGIETTRLIWQACPDLQIVICTAYTDCSWSEMQEQINPMDRLLILKKPFDTIEVLQLANALTEKWRLLQDSKKRLGDLDQMVRTRTRELEESRREALGMMQDAVESRQKAERAFEELTHEAQERRKLETQYREQASLLDKARDAIIVRDLQHRITYWNKSAERIYGWTAEEAIGLSLSNLLHQKPADFLVASAHVCEHGGWVGELQPTSKDGRTLIVEGRWTLVRAEDGRPQSILEIDTDITQQKKLEQQYLRAQRMEGIGTLAGGIAHDLNNVLAPIIMSIDLLKLAVTDKRGHDMLTVIGSSARRGADLVSQMLTFARGVEGKRVQVQTRTLIDDIEKITKDTFPKNIEIRTSFSHNLWTVHGDSTQLHQVLLNLCVNARDAMPEGGQINIRAENVILNKQFAAANIDAGPGGYVLLQVEDTGTGIPHSIIDSIFDPFFTTKDVGKGTGLGLATSLTIVKGHGGFIRVFSEPDKGSRFQVYLPAQDRASSPVPEPDGEAVMRGHGEVVLIVDDEEPIRQITQQTLESCGYRVMLAADGEQAVKLYSRHGQEIAVVLTDMMMPVMDGASTIQALIGMNPGVLTIAAGGIATSDSVARAMKLGAKMFLPKPFSAETLSRALGKVLAKESRPPKWQLVNGEIDGETEAAGHARCQETHQEAAVFC